MQGRSTTPPKNRIPTFKPSDYPLELLDPRAGTILGDGMVVYVSASGTVKPAFGSWPGSMPAIGVVNAPGTTVHTGTPVDIAVGGYKSAPQYGFTIGKTVYVSKIRPGSVTTNIGSMKIPQAVGISARGSALLIHVSPGTVGQDFVGTIGPSKIATGTYPRWAAGTLNVREQLRSGTVPAARLRAGTITIGPGTTHFIFENNQSAQWRDNAGGVRGMIYVDASNNMHLGLAGFASILVDSSTINLQNNVLQGLAKINSNMAGTPDANADLGAAVNRFRDLYISRNFAAGTVPAARISSGTITHTRYSQNLGSHLAGSVQTLPTVRYAVWPTAFPDNNYVTNMYVQFRASGTAQGPDDYRYGILSKKAGSVRYFVKTQAGIAGVGTIPPVGTVTLVGFAN